MRSRRKTPVLLATVGAALGACGGTAASTTGAHPAATAPAPARASATTVTIKGFAYRPSTVTVEHGARVTWVNRDAANHTVTFHHGRDLGNLDTGQRRSTVFRTRGTFAYVCQYHPFMKGRVIVR